MWSKAFIEEISHTPYHTDFRFICVDPSPQRPALPAWLKQIPTLVIRGESKPRTDNEVMNWLYEQCLRDGVKVRGLSSGTGTSVAPQEVDPEPYLDSEMGGGYGDSYAFIGDDTSAQGNGGNSMRHNFTYLNGQEAVGTKEASHFQTTTSTHKRSNKEEMLDQQYEQFMKAREQGMPQRISRQ